MDGETACPRAGCGKSTLSPFDLYCRKGDTTSNEFHFVVAGGNRRTQTSAIYLTRGLFGLLALLSARSGSRIPLDIAAGLAGLLVLALPLRRFRTSRVVAAAGWICIFVVTAAAHQGWLTAGEEDLAVTAVLLIAAVGLALAVALERGDGEVETLHRSVALGLAVALAAILVFFALVLGVGITSDAARNVSLFVTVAALGAAVGATTLSGFVLGFSVVRTDDIQPRAQHRLQEPPKLHFKDPDPPPVQDALSRTMHILHVAMFRLANGCAEVLHHAMRLAVSAVNALVHLGLRIELAVRLAGLWAFRLLGRAWIEAVKALNVAIRLLAAVTARWATSTVLALVLLIGAAQLAVIAAAIFTSYLGGATLLDGAGAPALMLAVAGALVAVWWALTRCPAGDVWQSALHTLEGAGPSLFLTLVALGWIDGIAGMLGFGPLRPGWLTVGGTVVLFVGGAYVLNRERRQRLSRSPA